MASVPYSSHCFVHYEYLYLVVRRVGADFYRDGNREDRKKIESNYIYKKEKKKKS